MFIYPLIPHSLMSGHDKFTIQLKDKYCKQNCFESNYNILIILYL